MFIKLNRNKDKQKKEVNYRFQIGKWSGFVVLLSIWLDRERSVVIWFELFGVLLYGLRFWQANIDWDEATKSLSSLKEDVFSKMAASVLIWFDN